MVGHGFFKGFSGLMQMGNPEEFWLFGMRCSLKWPLGWAVLNGSQFEEAER